MARSKRRRSTGESARKLSGGSATSADPIRDGKWLPSGGTLFLHSHVYDPDGVRPGDGLSGISDEITRSTVSAFDTAAARMSGHVEDREALLNDESILGPLASLIGVQASKLASG